MRSSVGCVIATGVTCRAAQFGNGHASAATAASRTTAQPERTFDDDMTLPTRGVWMNRPFAAILDLPRIALDFI